MSKDFIDCPAYQRGLAITGIIFGRIGIDTIDNHSIGLLVVEHGADIVLGEFRIEFSSAGTETPGVPCPESNKVAYCMARNDAFVKQPATMGTPVGDQCGNGFYGDTVILRFHIGAQYLGQIAFPTFGIGLQGFLRVVE